MCQNSSLEASVQVVTKSVHSMAGHSTMLQQRPCKALLPVAKAPRPERLSHRVTAHAQPARPSQANRASIAVQASATAEAPPAETTRGIEKPLGESPTVINGQVHIMLTMLTSIPIIDNSWRSSMS